MKDVLDAWDHPVKIQRSVLGILPAWICSVNATPDFLRTEMAAVRVSMEKNAQAAWIAMKTSFYSAMTRRSVPVWMIR
jgi:hypothetical protein